MDLADASSHPLAEQYPCRTPVWWARVGSEERNPSTVGVSGRIVVLRIEKRFNRFERWLARWFRAPREVRRPLDRMNSMLWELCDGSRTFLDVCRVLNDVFAEDVAPVVSRTAMALAQLQRNNLLLMLDEPLNGRWSIGPGLTPDHQSLDPRGHLEEYDVNRLPEEAA